MTNSTQAQVGLWAFLVLSTFNLFSGDPIAFWACLTVSCIFNAASLVIDELNNLKG